VFGPKRLFNPDTSARYDTRTLAVFCQPSDMRVPLYPGQRITAFLTDASQMSGTNQGPEQGQLSLVTARFDPRTVPARQAEPARD
jgi:hypothetical protein